MVVYSLSPTKKEYKGCFCEYFVIKGLRTKTKMVPRVCGWISASKLWSKLRIGKAISYANNFAIFELPFLRLWPFWKAWRHFWGSINKETHLRHSVALSSVLRGDSWQCHKMTQGGLTKMSRVIFGLNFTAKVFKKLCFL